MCIRDSANSLKNIVAPVALAVAFGVAANDAHALDFGCRDKEQIKKELMAENQVPVVRFYIGEVPSGESKAKWNENFFTMNTQTREGFRMSRGENTQMCIISKLTDIRLYNPRNFDKRAYLETEMYDFSGKRMSDIEILKQIEWYNKKENRLKVRQDLKNQNMTDNEIIETEQQVKRRNDLYFEIRKQGINSQISRIAGENPIFRAQEYSPILNLTRITFILANPSSGNEGGEIHATLDGKWLREFSKAIPNAQSGYANVDHGAIFTPAGQEVADQQAAKPQ